jgi:hypothetical protein
MTPRVLGREIEAAGLRTKDDYRRELTQAYNFARCYSMVRSKKGMPPLKKLLDEIKDTTGQQSEKGMLTALQILSAQLGVPLREVKPK